MNQSMNNGSPGHSTNSLSRSNTFTRMNGSPKCFGTTQYVHKDEFERERQRLQQKLDEAESKIVEATVNNSEMMQIKAELNKKIVEFERNQRPLIEQNKRLNDRNRIIQQELKRIEENLCHSQDDYLTLKDAYDRLNKENVQLKELRAFPEKLKELDRYRNQVLEYSKCINALRQSGLEKDRRYELLVQKFKRMKKCLTKRSDDDDRQSSYGSEGSTESYINLDTITEDIDETLDMENSPFSYEHDITLKLSAFALAEEQILKEQLEMANSTIAELQSALTIQASMSENQENMAMAASRQEKKIKDLQSECSSLKQQLMNTVENNDLLEFQILELRDASDSGISVQTEDKSCITDEFVADELESIFDDIKTFVQMDSDTIAQTKEHLQTLRKLACLKSNQRDALKKALQYIENLENKLSFAETELNMTKCEVKRLEARSKDQIQSLQQQINELESTASKKKKELQSELESTKKELKAIQKAIQEKDAFISQQKTKMSDIDAASKENCSLLGNKDNEIQNLQKILNDKESKYSEKLKQLQQKFDEQVVKSDAVIAELSKVKEDYSALINEKENLYAQVHVLNTKAKEKGEQLEDEVRQIQVDFEATKLDYEKQLGEVKKSKVLLENNYQELSNECKKVKQELVDTCKALQLSQNEWTTKVAVATRDAANAVDQCRQQAERRETELLEERQKLEQALQDKMKELEATKALLRPIGTQLERRYEENKFRLQQATKKADDYEKIIQQANQKIQTLESSDAIKEYVKQNEQLQEYNQQLQNQFDQQMIIIEALKKRLLPTNNNSEVMENKWMKQSAGSTSSIDDKQYHSESSSIGSYNAV